MAIRLTEVIEQQDDTQKGRYLTFHLGNEMFGLGIEHVLEIIGMYPITPIPDVPAFIKGIINLRSRIIPIIDMRVKFRKEEIGYTDRTCIIIVEMMELTVGLIVDQVADVRTIDDSIIAPPPETGVEIQNNYLMGVALLEGNIYLLLDCEKLLRLEEADIIKEIKK